MKSVDWMHLAQNRDVAGYCEYSNEHLGPIKDEEFHG